MHHRRWIALGAIPILSEFLRLPNRTASAISRRSNDRWRHSYSALNAGPRHLRHRHHIPRSTGVSRWLREAFERPPPYVSRCQLVRQLFAPREGDFELDPNALQEDYRLSGASQNSFSVPNSQNQPYYDVNGSNNSKGYSQSRAKQPRAQTSYGSHPSAYSNNNNHQQQRNAYGYGNPNSNASDAAIMP